MMNDLVLYILFGLIGFAAFLYLIVPLIILKAMGTARLDGVIQDSDPSDLNQEDQRYFQHSAEELQTIGFLPVGYVSIEGMIGPARMRLLLLVNESSRTLVCVTAVFAGGEKEASSRLLTFSTELEDGTEILTTNNGDARSPDRLKTHKQMQLAKVQDPLVLHRFHGAWVSEQAAGRSLRAIPMDTTPTQLLYAETRKEMQQKAQGRCWREAGEDVYKMTLTGAYLMAWAQLPPLKWINQANDRHDAEAFVSRSGIPMA